MRRPAEARDHFNRLRVEVGPLARPFGADAVHMIGKLSRHSAEMIA
jgi:hypothetical protein